MIAARGEAGLPDELPDEFAFATIGPNPFRQQTTLQFSLPEPADVRGEVFDILGRRLATLVDERKSAGIYQLHWQAGTVASGTYFIRLQANKFFATRRVTVVK